MGKFLHFDENFSHKVDKQMKPLIHLFAPIFFVTVGLSLNLRDINWNSQFVWFFSVTMITAAIIGKLASGFLLIGEKKWIKWAVGLAMIPRGEVGLIFAEVGLTNKVIDANLYAAMIIVISFTTVFAPFALRYFYSKKPNDPLNDSLQEQ
jgi:Kef-type K+ transport system membrane component KefB